jgi:hypothetical protein
MVQYFRGISRNAQQLQKKSERRGAGVDRSRRPALRPPAVIHLGRSRWSA